MAYAETDAGVRDGCLRINDDIMSKPAPSPTSKIDVGEGAGLDMISSFFLWPHPVWMKRMFKACEERKSDMVHNYYIPWL